MNPIVDGIRKDYGGRINFVYVEMDEASGKQRARDEGVMGTPTFLLLDSNGERAYMLQGVHQRVTMEQHLDALLSRK
jgi:thioredoxin-related protein